MDSFVRMYNEEGNEDDDLYEIIKNSTGTKNVIEIRNTRTKEKRLIYKDRVFVPEEISEEISEVVPEVVPEKRREEVTKKKAKKKPLTKFDLSALTEVGLLFKSKKQNTNRCVDGCRVSS